jgi:hypothetical protein
MLDAPRHRLQGVLNRPPGCGKRAEKAKKILNRGNEPKNILKTQGLTPLEAQKRTEFRVRKGPIKAKNTAKNRRTVGRKRRFQASGSKWQDLNQDSGVRSENPGFKIQGRSAGPVRQSRLPIPMKVVTDSDLIPKRNKGIAVPRYHLLSP